MRSPRCPYTRLPQEFRNLRIRPKGEELLAWSSLSSSSAERCRCPRDTWSIRWTDRAPELRQLATSCAKNARATSCNQGRSASLAWPWGEPVPTEFFRCLGLRVGKPPLKLPSQLFGAAKIALARSKTRPALWPANTAHWVTHPTTV